LIDDLDDWHTKIFTVIKDPNRFVFRVKSMRGEYIVYDQHLPIKEPSSFITITLSTGVLSSETH